MGGGGDGRRRTEEVILGNDAAWGGWAWCLGTVDGPLAVGHLRLAGRTWRWSALVDVLEGRVPVHRPGQVWPPHRDGQTWPMLLDELGIAHGRVLVEHAPAVYSGRGRGRPGNQAATGFGLGLLAGPVLTSGCRTQLAYPWEVEPMEWRRWWGITGTGGRAPAKARAIAIVRASTWGPFLSPFDDRGEDFGACGDVAEAILMTVGAARHVVDAPAGPRGHCWGSGPSGGDPSGGAPSIRAQGRPRSAASRQTDRSSASHTTSTTSC